MSPAGERRLVPAHVVVGGRSAGTHPELRDISLLTVQRVDTGGLSPEGARVVSLCSAGRGGLLSLAEIAAHLRLPRALACVLVGDLLDTGHLALISQPPPRIAGPRVGSSVPSTDLLQRVLDGLHKL